MFQHVNKQDAERSTMASCKIRGQGHDFLHITCYLQAYFAMHALVHLLDCSKPGREACFQPGTYLLTYLSRRTSYKEGCVINSPGSKVIAQADYMIRPGQAMNFRDGSALMMSGSKSSIPFLAPCLSSMHNRLERPSPRRIARFSSEEGL